MRCYSCDCELSDYEATRKSKVTNEYIDLCSDCFSTVQDIFIDMEDVILKNDDEPDEEEYEDG